MHYYQFNIKDYSFATIRMSLMEDLAFRRMLDLYYESEKPLPFELPRVAKLIGMIDHQEEIRSVLNEFWIESESGWENERAKAEIEKYHSKADAARANGKLGGRPKKPKKTQSVNLANPEKTESKANHKPITNNQELNIYRSSADAEEGFNYFWQRYPRKIGKKKAQDKFNSITKKMEFEEFKNFVDTITSYATKKYKETDEQFIPHGSAYMNQERWLDES